MKAQDRDPKFNNKDGTLTAYSLACGYVEQFDTANKRVTLWLDRGGCYHVRAHHFLGNGRLGWESFETLKEARAYYRMWVSKFKSEAKVKV